MREDGDPCPETEHVVPSRPFIKVKDEAPIRVVGCLELWRVEWGGEVRAASGSKGLHWCIL